MADGGVWPCFFMTISGTFRPFPKVRALAMSQERRRELGELPGHPSCNGLTLNILFTEVGLMLICIRYHPVPLVRPSLGRRTRGK